MDYLSQTDHLLPDIKTFLYLLTTLGLRSRNRHFTDPISIYPISLY